MRCLFPFKHLAKSLINLRILLSELDNHIVHDLMLSPDSLHLSKEAPLIIAQFTDLFMYCLVLSPLALLTWTLGNEDS
jgi:hypothetical protein